LCSRLASKTGLANHLKGRNKMQWARVTKQNGKFGVGVFKDKSPLSQMIEFIPCSCKLSAEKALERVLKELGRTYGGKQ
jgi:hypothetical protein